MADVIVYGFPVSTYVNIVRLVLTEKGVPFRFHDLEPDMGQARHLALHPFNRVPILEHDGFRIYETSAIALYADEAFKGPSLQPADLRQRAAMHRWLSALNAYFYPYMAYHLGHERIVYPNLGIAPDEKVVAAALPKIATCLEVMETELEANGDYLVAGSLSLADLFLLPSLTTLSRTPEGQEMLAGKPRIRDWWSRMQGRPAVRQVLAMVAPHINQPVEHARKWVDGHRPRY
ncbi:glutathione S-transferase family protein [Phenylobacterium sp.]|uniref:glutathione S-transferase family protein n=1 Tax=Phenylobacterium sp. TaxID=1871053 RepID=UPI002ED907DA